MSITDSPTQKSLIDVYPPGTPFTIREAWIEGLVTTQFGDRTMGKVLIAPTEGGTPQEFAVWGSLCEQIQQIEDGDVPGNYTVAKDGKRYLFSPAPGEPEGDPLAEAEAKSPGPDAEAASETQAEPTG